MRAIGLGCGVVLLAVLGCGPAAAGLITIGGFETGDFTGWTVTGERLDYGVTHAQAHSGLWGVRFADATGLTYISQMVTTTPGRSYQVSFYIANQAGSTNPINRGELWWNGILVDSGTNVPTFPWEQNLYILTATAASTELKLGFSSVPQLGYWSLDDVDVQAVPEPAVGFLCLGGAALLLAAGCFDSRIIRATAARK